MSKNALEITVLLSVWNLEICGVVEINKQEEGNDIRLTFRKEEGERITVLIKQMDSTNSEWPSARDNQIVQSKEPQWMFNAEKGDKVAWQLIKMEKLTNSFLAY